MGYRRLTSLTNRYIKLQNISFDFRPEDYFLCKLNNNLLGEFTLNYRIDRSEKGKDDDVGIIRMYLTKEEAQLCRDNGFTEIV